ncbi:MAG: choline-binding protein A, partial [Lachnoanaerobaculum saburreum]
MNQRKIMLREILKIFVLLLFTLFFMGIMQSKTYATSMSLDCTVNYVDKDGDLLHTQTESLSPLIMGMTDYQLTIPYGNLVKNSMLYYPVRVQSETPALPTTTVQILSPHINISVDPAYVHIGAYGLSKDYVIFCDMPKYNYEIHYVDEAGNQLIVDQGGEEYDMTWVALDHKEFASTNYNAGVEYIVKQNQAYPQAQYKYNSANDIQVLVGSNYPEYTIVCIPKPVATPSTPGGNTNGSGNTNG